MRCATLSWPAARASPVLENVLLHVVDKGLEVLDFEEPDFPRADPEVLGEDPGVPLPVVGEPSGPGGVPGVVGPSAACASCSASAAAAIDASISFRSKSRSPARMSRHAASASRPSRRQIRHASMISALADPA
jgi:hypothetical protein